MGGGGDPVLASTNAIANNVWANVAVVRDSTTSLKIYVNGVLDGTATISSSLATDLSNGSMYVGRGFDVDGTNAYFTGYVSNIRVTKGGAVYTSAFTPSTTPLTTTVPSGTVSFLSCQSNRFVDNSTNAFTITANGTPSVQAFSPFLPTIAYDAAVVGGSGYFDGSDYLNFTDTSNTLDMGGAVTSLEGFFYPTATSSSQCLVAKGGGSGSWSTGSGFEWQLTYSSSKFDFTFNNAGSPANVASATVPINQWYYVAVATDASNNISLYLNGTRVATSTNAITKPTSRTLMYLGQDVSGSYFTGYMSGVRFIGGSGAYNPTSTTITVPTAPPTAITNTQLLTNFTNAGIFDSASKKNLETVGTAQVSTTQAKFGTTSMYFAGSGNYLLTPYSPTLVFGTADFTFECQLYWTGGNSENNLIMNNASGGFNVKLQATTATNWALENAYVGQVADFGTAPTQNTWHHIAITRASGTLYAFIDGTQVYSGANTTNFVNTASWYVAGNGASASLYMTGYIDDLRITTGYARYTASFTPPTAAFPLQ
jgi:hypothetical protein